MSIKRIRKTPKKSAKTKVAAKPRLEPEFIEPVLSRGEQAWQSLNGFTPGEDDRWNSVEEHLLGQAREKAHSLRRWKYFAR